MPNETDLWREFGQIAAIFLFIGVVFELSLIGFAYFNADHVECNLLWCTFTDAKELKITSSQECFQNGVQINCSKAFDIEKIMQDVEKWKLKN